MTTLSQIRANLPAYPIDVTFPDIARWKKSNTGVDYIHSFDSGVEGPHVMIMALTHGNEVSGAITLNTLLGAGLRPVKGRLSFGFANVKAYQLFDKNNPDATRFVDEDLNRVWGDAVLQGERDSHEIRRAREMRPFLDTVDLLLDIHSMHEASAPVMMCGPLDKGVSFAAKLGFPEHVIIDAGHENGKRLRDYGDFGDLHSDRNALLIETGQHFSLASQNVAMDTTCRFLIDSGVVTLNQVQIFLTEKKPTRQCFIEITQAVVARSMNFTFVEHFIGLEVIAKAGTVIAHDADHEIRTPYDNCVIVQPSLRQLAPGVTVARLGKIIDVPVHLSAP